MAEEVVDNILWTDSAKFSFNKIVSYLQDNWSEKEVEKFVNKTAEMLATLKKYPQMCRPSLKKKNVRIGILDKHTQIVYHYKPVKRQIQILLFWGMAQSPSKFKY
jgi:plasmid stabilization system protein ParE